MTKGRVLLADPDESVRLTLQTVLQLDGYDVVQAGSRRTARQSIEATRPDLLVVAAAQPDGSALDLLSELDRIDPTLPCVVLARREEIDVAVQAIQDGAEQFLIKPIQLTSFLLVVDRVLENERNRRRRIRDEARSSRERRDPFVGTSAAIRALAKYAERVAGSHIPVLIQGETGTGKGILAFWLHRNGPRAEECFLDLNCAGLSPEFLESELFGHEKGAFTGAVATKMGLLEVAHRGTLFLDEVGDIPLTVQPKLLKVLEEKRFRRLGDVRERQVDIRLIAASHENLASLVEKKRFREDLYFRINTVVLKIPALRDRLEDLVFLAEAFLAEIARELGRGRLQLAPGSIDKLAEHRWPGNVRELRNALERAVLLSPRDELGPEDFSFDSRGDAAGNPTDPTLLESEKQLIRRTLEAERGRVARAAEVLGISRSSLYQKIRRYRIAVSRS